MPLELTDLASLQQERPLGLDRGRACVVQNVPSKASEGDLGGRDSGDVHPSSSSVSAKEVGTRLRFDAEFVVALVERQRQDVALNDSRNNR